MWHEADAVIAVCFEYLLGQKEILPSESLKTILLELLLCKHHSCDEDLRVFSKSEYIVRCISVSGIP